MNPTSKTFARTCFIIAPGNTDISPVTRSLQSRGIEYKAQDRFEWGTTLETLREQIRSADFVCAFSTGALPPNMIFEIGVAIGQGKPIFMVASEGLPLPAELRSMSFISANEWNNDIIEPHLDAFLDTLPKRSVRSSPKTKRTATPLDFSSERKQLALFDREVSPRDFEVFVANLFRKASINVTVSPLEDFGADFALTSPEIKRRFGNPILVEVKHSRVGSDPRFVVGRLAQLIANGRGSAALLVTREPAPVAPYFAALGERQPPIYVVTVKELLDSLERGELVEDIWAYRSRRPGS